MDIFRYDCYKILQKGKIFIYILVSMWVLPSFFYKSLTQVHQDSWQLLDKERRRVKTGIGQEFVTDMTEDAHRWLRELFERNWVGVRKQA